MLKDYLNEKKISFVERIIDQNDTAREEMESKSGGYLGVPFTVFALGEGKEETVLGFDKGKLDKLLSLSGGNSSSISN